MRMRDLPEPESPPVDARMLEFVERRREEQARARRQRIQLIAIIALSVIAVVLTISNAVLVSRLLARPVTPPAVNLPAVRSAEPAQPAEPTDPSESTASAPELEASEPARLASPELSRPEPPRSVTRPPASRPRVGARVPEPPVPAPTPGDMGARERARRESSVAVDQAPSVAPEPPALPERAAGGSRSAGVAERARPGASRDMLTSAESDPALRTARWMLQTYGRLDAETKALAAAQFYSGGEGAFWRRVVSYVRAER